MNIKEKTYSSNDSLRHLPVKNWCLKRSRLLYAIASKVLSGDVRINIAMRCRQNAVNDWGHAWVSCDGKPLFEHINKRISKRIIKIGESGRYIYWIIK